MARKPYRLMSAHSGEIDFRREPKRNGGGIVAVFPLGALARDGSRVILTEHEGHVHVPSRYLRTCRGIDPESKEDRDRAAVLLARINAQDEYERALAHSHPWDTVAA